MITTNRTDSGNADFQALVRELDHDLSIRDGEDHAFYAQFNKTGSLAHAMVAYEDASPIGCGALKKYSDDTMEVKRMYVAPHKRRQGMAATILSALEAWTRELGYKKCILETGKNQPEAIALYKKCGYTIIPNYGQYKGIDNSVCFERSLIPAP